MDLSDDSFAWSDASNDSDTMAFDIKEENEDSLLVNNKRNSTENSTEDRPQGTKKKSKKRKYEEIAEVDKNEDDKVKQIKSETDSDFEKPKKKKKKHKEEVSNVEESQDTMDYDDSYLNYKVKQEQLSFAEPAQVKPKKKKRRTLETDSVILEEVDVKNYEIDTDITIEENHLEEIKSEEVEVKKKKKKSKTDAVASNDDFEPSDDNFKSKKKSKSKKRDKKSASKSFNESEVSQIDEISCIESSKLVNNFLDDDHIMEKSNGDIHNESNEAKVRDTSHSKSSKEVSKISDRLRFEDEESVDFEPNHVENTNLSINLRNFLNNRKDLSLLKATVATASTVTDDDEIWIVKAPHEINIKDFKDVNVKLDTKSKLKFNGQTYDLICDNSIEKTPILSHNKNKAYIKHIPVKGVINLRKRIPKAHIPEENVIVNHQPTFIPLPETKCRHPLFGVNYKKATKISPSIAERLNDSSSSPMLNGDVEKRKKHKKEKRKTEVESEVETKPLDDTPVVSKKKRKRKSSIKDEPVSKKAKYVKNESESADVWESEKAIEKNLFDF